MRKVNTLIFFTTFFLYSGVFNVGYAQTYFGFKAGVNASKAYFDSEVYQKFYTTKIKPGYTVGGVFLIENKERYGLYTEFLYSVKGKSVESRANDYETNIASYQFLDFPIMFRVKFKQKKYNWFLQLGPEISYWLGGKGAFEVYQPDRDIIVTYEYTLNFGERQNTSDIMNVEDANRVQLGLALGGGFIWDLNNGNHISFDMRFSFGHTFMGGYESGSIPNIGLKDNFEHTNNTLSISAVYYFDIMEKIRLSKNKYRKR